RIIELWTKIPASKIKAQEYQQIKGLADRLKTHIVGQDEAVEAVAKAIRRNRVGISPKKRPVSFIFVGPTGVGKTELSKTLADAMFGTENALIRVDMSEYMEKHSVSKLIGSPPGYVGFDDGGQLTEQIRRKPYSVVLFDEIEKAHPDVFNILLQILEDGILTDSRGRHVDFKNTVIIMTSNVGASGITEPRRLGFAGADDPSGEKLRMKNAVNDALKATFKPEFLNRLDEIIVFNKLTSENINAIASIMLRDVMRRVSELGITLDFDADVVEKLAAEGFDPVYGARPLRRAIVRQIEDSFSEAMLRGDIVAGDKVRAKVLDEKIVYEKE
ncbi:MAG: ATP-dependent Clp protease ATP-binding subunit, partial [Clostridia bacterium]|nr:ATP-dependent Clp protease ATP-binding subunit [Clostridia bacterium]